MNIKNLEQSLVAMSEIGVPLMLVGNHGEGKTETVVRAFTKEGHMVYVKNLQNDEVGDIKGLPIEEKDKTGRVTKVRFAPPEWVTRLYDFAVANPNKKAILFLDEINHAKQDVKNVCYPLLTHRRLDDIQFPSNFYVIAAMNPATEDYADLKEERNKAFIDRFCHIKVQATVQEWLNYATSAGVSTDLVGFITENPDALRSAALERFDLSFREPSPRSIIALDRITKLSIPDDAKKELMAGMVGNEFIARFNAHRQNAEKPVKAERILGNDKSMPQLLKSQTERGRGDLIQAAGTALITELTKMQELRQVLTEDQINGIINFVGAINADYAVKILTEIAEMPIAIRSKMLTLENEVISQIVERAITTETTEGV